MQTMPRPQANPSALALKRRDLSPKADFRATKHRQTAANGHGIEFARQATKSTSSAASAAEIDPDKPLTAKQKQFVEAWAKGESVPNACLRAGYADDGLGYRMVRMPNVLAYKAEFERKYEAAAEMTRKKVMDMLIESYDMAKLMAEPSTMVAAAREVGKMCGYYAPVETRVKVDVSGNIVMDRLSSMSDEELLAIITKGNAPAAPLEIEHDASGPDED